MAALVLILYGLEQGGRGQNVWAGWQASPELRRPAYAERVRSDEVFRTRANTWSNLAYVLVGLYAFALGWHDRQEKLSRASRHPESVRGYPESIRGYVRHTPAMSFLFGGACCFLGAGSGLFHASLSRRGQQLDVAAMYAPLLALIAVNLGRWYPRVQAGRVCRSVPSWPLLTGLVVLASFLLYHYKWSMSSGVVLPVLILAVGGFAVLDLFRADGRGALFWLALAGVALALAVVCRQLDVAGRFSGPDSWLQGHAFWHLLTSGSLGCMYLYQRSVRG
jgi:hypothetical protein